MRCALATPKIAKSISGFVCQDISKIYQRFSKANWRLIMILNDCPRLLDAIWRFVTRAFFQSFQRNFGKTYCPQSKIIIDDLVTYRAQLKSHHNNLNKALSLKRGFLLRPFYLLPRVLRFSAYWGQKDERSWGRDCSLTGF